MITPDTAAIIARIAHAGQVDKSGKPYIGHPNRVASYLGNVGVVDEIVAVGYLHDVLEDTPVTMDDLVALGLTIRQEEALDSITKRDYEQYFEYVERLRQNPDAGDIKRADLQDNMDPNRGRFAGAESLAKRYEKTVRILDGDEK